MPGPGEPQEFQVSPGELKEALESLNINKILIFLYRSITASKTCCN
jgi:hypothetical protein